MLITFHLLLNCFLLFSSLFIFLVENSIHSILFLVLTFLNASVICFLFGADFLGLILIIIYVGAIAVLFLFVVMMLNVKTQLWGAFKFFPFFIFLSLILLIQLYLVLSSYITNYDFLTEPFFFFESLTTDFFLGQALYNYFLVCFLIAGLLLLLGMIGAIVLTLKFSNKKKRHEIAFRQLSRSDFILTFFK